MQLVGLWYAWLVLLAALFITAYVVYYMVLTLSKSKMGFWYQIIIVMLIMAAVFVFVLMFGFFPLLLV